MDAPTTAPQRDPRVALFLGSLNAVGWPSISVRTVRQARHDLRLLAAVTGTWRPLRYVADALADGPDRPIPVRIYRSGTGTAPDRPLVVYLHGGGWVVGDLFTADGVCRRLAAATGATVVSVHYRRAPEHPLPAAQVDAYAATCWAIAHASELGADPTRVVLAGDSAGGGLAAHVAHRLHDDGPVDAALQVLINPGLDFTFEHADRDPALAQLLDWETIDWFASHTFPPGVDRADPTISPARREDLTGMPPALFITAGLDPFRSDAEHYAERLEEAGVPATVHRFDGQIHGFTDMDLIMPAARRALRVIADAITTVDTVAHPADLSAADSPIRWARPDRGLARRLRESAQRLPLVSAPDTIWNLARARFDLTSAPIPRPFGGRR